MDNIGTYMSMDNQMLPNEAFAKVLEKYELKQNELVKKSGVDKGVVSRFLSGKSDIKSRNLQKLVKALPVQARAYYHALHAFDYEIDCKKVAEKASKYRI